jgi:hypothetical protein
MKTVVFIIVLFTSNFCYCQFDFDADWIKIKFINQWKKSGVGNQKVMLKDYVFDFAWRTNQKNEIHNVCSRSKSETLFSISEVVDVTNYFVQYFVKSNPQNDSLHYCVYKFLSAHQTLLTFDQKTQVYDWIYSTYLENRNSRRQILSEIELKRLVTVIQLLFHKKFVLWAKVEIEKNYPNFKLEELSLQYSDTIFLSKCSCR